MPTAIPAVEYSKPILYGDWLIYRNDFTAHPDWRSIAWCFVHKDYDGPEDNRCGFGPTIEDVVVQIQDREDD